MKRDDFLNELEQKLGDIPEGDRLDAIEYYYDYFDEAGEENEQKVIRELGSPERVAQTIRDNLGASGYTSSRDYSDPRDYSESRDYSEPRDYSAPEDSGNTRNYDDSYENSSSKWQERTSRKTTSWVLILSGVAATIGVVCIVIACSMGLTWGTFTDMVNDGRFRIDFGNEIDFFGIGVHVGNSEGESGQLDVTEEITKLDIEFGAGVLDIHYGDVEEIHIDYEYVIGFETSVKNGTLRVEGAVGVGDNSGGALVITIPEGMTFEKVDLEIGASEAQIRDLVADKVDVAVGVGAATIQNLKVKNLDAETGVGQLTIELDGKAEDYSYNLDCGIGAVVIGENSYGGLGASHSVKNPDATCQMDIDCGIGEVVIVFSE